MNLFRYVILGLILLNIPSFFRDYSTVTMASILSYSTYGLLLLYYFLNKKHTLAWPFVIFAFAYFIISGLVDAPEGNDYFVDFIKYLIVIICGGEVARSTSFKELMLFLLLAITSVLVHTAVFPDDYGRYSGFFLDPNAAGFVCLMGCAMAFEIKTEKTRLLVLFFCTFCGVLTFSRTFFLLWTIIILISIFQSKKNVKIAGIGIGVILLVLSVSTIFKLNPERLSIVENITRIDVVNKAMTTNSRRDTWASYYNIILDSPFVGNGYRSFVGVEDVRSGIHNSYLRIFGESGIIPLIIYIGIYGIILLRSFKTFRTRPYQFLLAISIIAFLLTNHNFVTNNYITFISVWLYFRLTDNQNTSPSIVVDHYSTK